MVFKNLIMILLLCISFVPGLLVIRSYYIMILTENWFKKFKRLTIWTKVLSTYKNSSNDSKSFARGIKKRFKFSQSEFNSSLKVYNEIISTTISNPKSICIFLVPLINQQKYTTYSDVKIISLVFNLTVQ